MTQQSLTRADILTEAQHWVRDNTADASALRAFMQAGGEIEIAGERFEFVGSRPQNPWPASRDDWFITYIEVYVPSGLTVLGAA